MDPETNSFGPPAKSFHFTELSEHVNTKGKGKPRGTPKASKKGPQVKTLHKPVDIEKCALYELVQYNCPEPTKVKKGDPPNDVICTPFQRLFRRCAEGLTIETTEWEFMGEE